MPKSKVRKKTVYTPPTDRRTPVKVKAVGPSHPVYVTVMLGMMLLGLAWLVAYYLVPTGIPVMESLGLVELPDRLRADDRRAADDDAVALTAAHDA